MEAWSWYELPSKCFWLQTTIRTAHSVAHKVLTIRLLLQTHDFPAMQASRLTNLFLVTCKTRLQAIILACRTWCACRRPSITKHTSSSNFSVRTIYYQTHQDMQPHMTIWVTKASLHKMREFCSYGPWNTAKTSIFTTIATQNRENL